MAIIRPSADLRNKYKETERFEYIGNFKLTTTLVSSSLKEIVVTPKNHKVFCPECKMYHLLPDGVSRSMEKLKEMNMCEESW